MELSILIPTYNCCCAELVKTLHRQATAAGQGSGGLRFEIIVADDGSTDPATVEANREIDTLSHCRYIVNTVNRGRAAIRNFLAREARYGTLLFIDSDRKPYSDKFIEKYAMLTNVSVVQGGLKVEGDREKLANNIRYRLEKKYESQHSAVKREKDPYKNFNTSNFLTRRDILLKYPFDERFRRYGYEDVMWGKTLHDNNVPIIHIDNPIIIDEYESNPGFISKTDEGIHTLFNFRDELRGYSGIITMADRTASLHLTHAAAALHRLFSRAIINNLKGNKPSLFLFNIYKLGLLCTLLTQAENRNHRNHPQ